MTLQVEPAVFLQLLAVCKLHPEDAAAWRPPGGTCLPLLLAAHFLRMPPLVERCLALLATAPELLAEQAALVLSLDRPLLEGLARVRGGWSMLPAPA